MEKNIESKTEKTKTTMNKISLPLLVCLVGFPQISETIFTPSLTEIAKGYAVSLNVAQMTLSIYFLAFALGVFFWGISSDFIGRRKAMNFGIAVYIIGCIFCYVSPNIFSLFAGRFIQAFGASTGSVTTQTILRDHYQGKERHQLFAQISAALAFSPAIGPLIGGFIGQYYGFRFVFLSLVVMGALLLVWSLRKLPETMTADNNKMNRREVLVVGKKMLLDRYTVVFGILIGIFNGLLFSYHAEAPVIFIENFHFSQSAYGFMGIIVALATILGAMLSKSSLEKIPAKQIIRNGILLAIGGSLFIAMSALININGILLTVLYIMGIFILLAGIGMALPNCLSLALSHFSQVAGTAGAFLSLGYYILVSIFTFLISVVHNGSIIVLPIFCLIPLLIALVVLRSEK